MTLSPPIVILIVLNDPGNISPAQPTGMSLPPMPPAAVDVELFFLETAHANTLDVLTMAQGSMFSTFDLVHGAILVAHGEDSFLFDTGLGSHIDSQFDIDMPSWLKPLMAYEKGESVVEQLRKSDLLPQPGRIFLSHAHWDHASGVVDFPQLETWLPSAEYEYMQTAAPPAVLPSQVSSPDIKWRQYDLSETEYAGFAQSYDIYGDGTVVLVGLPGHTPGSVGLFVNSKDGVRRFFVGDTVWNLDAVRKLRGKFWVSSLMVDLDRDAADRNVARLHALMDVNPDLRIIPAHDRREWK